MADHYIGCLTDFPDCRCLRCDRDDCEFDAPCCLEHGHPCNSDRYCPDFIDENEGRVRRWLRKVFRRGIPPVGCADILPLTRGAREKEGEDVV